MAFPDPVLSRCLDCTNAHLLGAASVQEGKIKPADGSVPQESDFAAERWE